MTGSRGWYPDPWFTGQRRWWDGASWTSDVFPDGPPSEHGAVAPREGAVAAHGQPPMSPAAPPPPAPGWREERPVEPPPPEPTWLPPADPQPRRSNLLPALAVTGAVAVLVVGALIAVLLMRSPSTVGTVSAAPTSSGSPSAASPSAPAPSPSATAPGSPVPGPSPSGGAQSPAPAPSGSGQPAQPPGGGAPGSAASLLQTLVVRQVDVPSGYLVGTIRGGDQVQGETTLDLCDATYPSESLRTDRLQTLAVSPAGTPMLSTEAVMYASESATAQAFQEIKAAASACSRTSPGTSVGVRPDATWGTTQGVERLAYTVVSTDATGARQKSLVVYLRRGNVLLGVYFPNADSRQMPVEDATTVPAIVKLFEERLIRGGAATSSGSGGGGGTTA